MEVFNFPRTQQVLGTDSVETINARDLHKALKVGRDFSNWIKDRLNRGKFVENEHYVVIADFVENSHGGQNKRAYYITLDVALYIAKHEKSDVAPAVYNYFLACTGRDLAVIRDARLEHKFGELLIPFCNAFGVDVEPQYNVLNYRVDFVVGGRIFVEYDEEYHTRQVEADKAREKAINAVMLDYGVEPVWVRVRQGNEGFGLASIAKLLG